MNDPLAPARGCLRGALYGAAIWAAAIPLGIAVFFHGRVVNCESDGWFRLCDHPLAVG